MKPGKKIVQDANNNITRCAGGTYIAIEEEIKSLQLAIRLLQFGCKSLYYLKGNLDISAMNGIIQSNTGFNSSVAQSQIAGSATMTIIGGVVSIN